MKNIYHTSFRNLLAVTTIAGTLFMSACRPEFYQPNDGGPATQGNADFSKYVAVGSTITSGYADNALYTEGQENAYPSLLAKQFKEANAATAYVVPEIGTTTGWSGGTNGRFELVMPACSTIAVSGKALAGESGLLPFSGDKNSITNLSVPFISIKNINNNTIPASSNYNAARPYFDRITDVGTLGIASEAAKRNGSFFTVWLGYVDALRYATSGGTATLPTTAEFKQNIEAILDSLLANGSSKGVIANVPYVDLFPVVTNNNRRLTSSNDPARNPVRFTQDQADYYNTAIGANLFSGATGNKNNYAITTGIGSVRKLDTGKDFIVRGNVLDSVGIGPRDSLAARDCTPNLTPRNEIGFITPINNNAVLDKDEVTALRAQIDEYNNAIKEAVDARNASGIRIAIVDLKAFYTKLTDANQGIAYGTSLVRANHPSLGPDFGGFYSLDRTQPTPKGHALLANEFIKAINTTFGANVHQLNPDNYRGNKIPQ